MNCKHAQNTVTALVLLLSVELRYLNANFLWCLMAYT